MSRYDNFPGWRGPGYATDFMWHRRPYGAEYVPRGNAYPESGGVPGRNHRGSNSGRRGHWFDDFPREDRFRDEAPGAPSARVGWNRWLEIGMEDDEIRQAVRESLHQDTALPAERIQVEVNGGVVRLSGDVDDYLEVRYAWDDAWGTPGVRGVINDLTVRSPTAGPEEDGAG